MKRVFLPLFFYSMCFIYLFRPFVFAEKNTLLFGIDILHLLYFYRQFFNTWIHAGIFPWWNPYAFSGVPFIANPSINIWYPPNWIYSLLPLPYAYIVHMWFHLTLGAYGTYLLLRFFLPKKESFIPALIGGLVFSLSGFFSARILAGHVDVIAAASYMPMVVFLFFRLTEHRRLSDIALTGLVFGLQLLSGYYTMSFFTLITVGFVYLGYAIHHKTIRHSIPFCVGVLLGLSVSAISTLPAQEFVLSSMRSISGRPYELASSGSMPVISFLLQLIAPFPYGEPFSYTGPPPNFYEHAYFFGTATFGVICVGFFIALFQKKKKLLYYWIVFFAIIFFGIWMSIGKYAPVDLLRILWNIVPFYKMLRIPPRHLILVVFSASVLFGFGLSLIKNKLLQMALSVCVVVELFLYAGVFIRPSVIPDVSHDTELIAFLQNDAGVFRILPNFDCSLEPRSALDFDEPMTHRIFSATGYDPILYRPYYDFIDAANGTKDSSMWINAIQIPRLNLNSTAINFLNIKYVFTPIGIGDPLNGKSTEQFLLVKENIDRQYRLYENTHFFPRFFLVPSVKVFSSEERVAEAIRNKAIDFSQEVGVWGPDADVPTQVCHEDRTEASVQVVSYTPNTILLHVSHPCDEFLVSSEVMYPGWTATIDGMPVKIFTGNMAFRTLFVPKGDHTISYTFVPTLWCIGGIISAVSIGIILVFIGYTWYSDSRHRTLSVH